MELNLQKQAVMIGNLELGAGNPVRIQSMLNTRINEVDACVRQAMELAEAGCDMIRLAVPRLKDCHYLEKIKSQLIQGGILLPLVADVHFQPDIAFEAARIVEKVRINPGNFFEIKTQTGTYPDTLPDAVQNKLFHLAEICNTHHTAIRIGSNHGSLSGRISYLYGNTAKGLAESVLEYARVFRAQGFDNLVLSVKSSNIAITLESNRLLEAGMSRENMNYLIHLGLTEAGSQKEGVIKSSMAIGTLLLEGIGDTIRVSLAGNPVNEIPVALAILNSVEDIQSSVEKNTFPLHIPKFPNPQLPFPLILADKGLAIPPYVDEVYHFSSDKKSIVSKNLKAIKLLFPTDRPVINSVIQQAYYFELDKDLSGLKKLYEIKLKYPEVPIITALTNKSPAGKEALAGLSVKAGIVLINRLSDGLYLPALEVEDTAIIFQVAGRKTYQAEYICCPSCGRTQFDIEKLTDEVKHKTGHLVGLKIAVMGCIVNGPGEMADADFGLMGGPKGKVHVFNGQQIVRKNVNAAVAVSALIEVIQENGKSKKAKGKRQK